MNVFIQIILVVVILAAMIMVLLGIDQLFTGRFDADNEKARKLRHDVDNNHEVISDSNIFHSIVTSDRKVEHRDTRTYR